MLRFLWSLLFIYSTYSYHLYRTDQSLYLRADYHTCFYSHIKETFAFDLKTHQSAYIPYCIRDSLLDDKKPKEQCNGELYTFEYMYKHNWTSLKLVDLNAPYDLIDNYQNYIDSNQLLNQQLYYCHCKNERSFGEQCEYTFKSQYNAKTFYQHLAIYYNLRHSMSINSMYEITNGTCYVDIDCTTNSLCLQWSEICDGKRDCLNGKDEENCSVFELLECDTDYRCLNGFHCIPKEFSFDFSSDCTDGSDEQFYSVCDSKTSPFGCSDNHCGWGSFSCGDGECIEFQFNSNNPNDEHCQNQRDWYFIQNLLIKSQSMNEICWKSLLCLFGLQHYFPSEINECINKLDKCSELIRFPFTKYLYLDYYVYFIYKREQLFNNSPVIIKPDYVCFDRNQCPTMCSINETIMDGFYICCQLKLPIKLGKQQWQKLYNLIYDLFKEKCFSIYYPDLDYNQINNCSKPLFHCLKTQKCISRHRVSDGIEDCSDGSDEDDDINSCALNISNRFQCSTSKHQCIPRYFVLNDEPDCLDGSDEKYPDKCLERYQSAYACDFIRGTTSLSIVNYVFRDICNGLIEHQYENETDETDCHLWPCASPSTICNQKWDCPNGLDEVNCPGMHQSSMTMTKHCQTNEHICIEVTTRKWSCLPLDRAGDQYIDCIGGIDEQYNNSCTKQKTNHFQCYNSTKCISSNELCNGINDCPFHDDEETICPWLKKNSSNCALKKNFLCQRDKCLPRKDQCNKILQCIDGEDEWFCFDNKNNPSIEYSSVIPQFRQNSLELSLVNHSWFCNFGLPIYSIDENTIKKCLCPPSLYGERCQYQSNRLILIYRIDIPQYLENQMMKFVFYLYNINTTEILDYDEIVHLTIRTTFQPRKYITYLIYPSKEIKKRQHGMMYGVRVNSYFVTNTKIEFQCAWFFIISMYNNILPVQRIVTRLIFDVNRLYFQCSSKKYCNSNGLCKQYMNNPDLFYCQCYQQWFGNQCQFRIPTVLSLICSKESLTIYDSIQNKSICICSLSKLGPTCRVPHPYNQCQNDLLSCANNGICSLTDARESDTNLFCLCPEQYGGYQCKSEARQILLKLSHSLTSNKYLSAIVYYFAQFLRPNSTVSSVGWYHTEEEEASFLLYIIETKLITMNFKSISPIYLRPDNWMIDSYSDQKHYFSVTQVYFNNLSQQVYYYNHNYINASLKNLNTLIGYEQCLSIRDLFNSTILEYNPLKRLKYYHQPCLENLTKCFYDDVYLCLCNSRHHFSSCYFFSFNRSQCSTNICQNQGKCLQDDERSNTLNYKCLCQKCYNGKLCQYSTSDYSLSLDVLISDDLNTHIGTKLSQQTIIVQCCFYLIINLVLFGFIFNLLTFVTFSQSGSRKTGSGIFLLVLSIVNQLNLLLFLIRFLFLIQFETTLYFCKISEYLAKLFPSISDWLSTFVTIERALFVFNGLKFNKENSRKFAKMIILLILIIQSIIYFHEFLYRQLIQDLLAYDNNRQWCVITFDHLNWLKIYNVIINILNIVLPFLCDFICASYILIKISIVRLQSQRQRTFGNVLYNEFIKNKHLLTSPLLLILLNLPRLIFLFIFPCFNPSLEWQKYLLLIIYFLSFMPRLLTFFLFVLTSPLYRNEMKLVFDNLLLLFKHI